MGDVVFGLTAGGAYAQYALGSIFALKPKEVGLATAVALPAADTAARLDFVRTCDLRGESPCNHTLV